MQALLGTEYPAFAASLESEPVTGVRFNPLKLNRESFQSRFRARLDPLPWCHTGFTYDSLEPGFQPGKHPDHVAGLYYLQEPSAMAAAELLAPQPGQRVLDLAAAPGGKATHLAALMDDHGWLLANEIHPKRAWTLAENLERWGITCASVTNETPERLAIHMGSIFDRVLVDAPCSGEALFRRSPAARDEWSMESVKACAYRQAMILEQAARLVAPGGRIGYVTCTFNPQEGEATLAQLLAAHPEFSLVNLPRSPGFHPGRPDWLTGDRQPALLNAVRLWPHLATCEGHFVAILEKENTISDRKTPPRNSKRARSDKHTIQSALKFYEDFCRESLVEPSWQGPLSLAGSYLYELPELRVDLGGLKVLHPGRWLGILKKNRFEPAHALALSLTPAQARHVVSFELNHPALTRYLRGESTDLSGEAGWCLVCADEYPIGWGKISGGKLKSHYPKGLRWF